MGELPRTEAVMLQARLRFAPERVAAGTKFAPREGEAAVFDPCDTAFYKDVHRVYEELSEKEREELRGYSPDLQVIMDARAAKSPPGVTALPEFSLERQLTSVNCIVHYSMTNIPHTVPDEEYARTVQTYMEIAIQGKMTRKHFRKAYTEGTSNGVGKLHVYIMSMSGNGEWVDVSSVSGDKMAGYIKISNAIKTRYGNMWLLKMKGLCHHEYFHGIQSAYNAWSTLWFLEATAVWSQYYYAKEYVSFTDYFGAAESVINKPNAPIWVNTYRKYSTCALAYYLSDKYKGYKFLQAYFKNSEAKKDAIELLKDTIAAHGSTFEAEYVKFWAAMATKRVLSLAKYMPVVPPTHTINTYGTKDVTGEVYLTGAVIHQCDPQAGAKGETLIMEMTSGGNVKGALAYGKRPVVQECVDGKSWVEKFGKKAKTVFVIITDPVYSGVDATARVFKYGVILPYVEIKSIRTISPIYAGEFSDMVITYDLLGTYPNEPFRTQVRVTEKSPDISDYVTGVQPLPIGENASVTVRLTTIEEKWGVFRFAYEFAVPEDAWKTPQVKSKAKTKVIVLEPKPKSAGRGATAMRQASISLQPGR